MVSRDSPSHYRCTFARGTGVWVSERVWGDLLSVVFGGSQKTHRASVMLVSFKPCVICLLL